MRLLSLLFIALLLSACSSAAHIIPDVEITSASVSGDAHIRGVVGIVPWGIDAKATEDGASVCVSVFVWEHCEEVP